MNTPQRPLHDHIALWIMWWTNCRLGCVMCWMNIRQQPHETICKSQIIIQNRPYSVAVEVLVIVIYIGPYKTGRWCESSEWKQKCVSMADWKMVRKNFCFFQFKNLGPKKVPQLRKIPNKSRKKSWIFRVALTALRLDRIKFCSIKSTTDI